MTTYTQTELLVSNSIFLADLQQTCHLILHHFDKPRIIAINPAEL